MQSSEFIFAKKYRLHRHLLFWISWWLFCSFLYAFTPSIVAVPAAERFAISSVEALIYLVPHSFLSYTLMYFVVPQFLLKTKYVYTAISVVVLFLLTATISAMLGIYVTPVVREFIFPSSLDKAFRNSLNATFYLALLAGLRGAITVGGLAASIKIMKHWYIKEQRNMQLQKENIQSQLQVLKAQVHPHFLFNTLNNIYSYTQNTSPVASKLVMGLSDMLRYMLYECNQPLVPLPNELKMLQDYITVEKIRYGNKLDIHFDTPANAAEFEIAPLLLLPFVENSFKHGASQMLDQPWLSLSITIVDSSMHMKLVNGKAEGYQTPPNASGLGIQNVKHRLALLYLGKHELKIQNEDDVFIVDLRLEIEKRSTLIKQGRSLEKLVTYE